jgi:hypothetical protein
MQAMKYIDTHTHEKLLKNLPNFRKQKNTSKEMHSYTLKQNPPTFENANNKM